MSKPTLGDFRRMRVDYPQETDKLCFHVYEVNERGKRVFVHVLCSIHAVYELLALLTGGQVDIELVLYSSTLVGSARLVHREGRWQIARLRKGRAIVETWLHRMECDVKL